MNDAKYDSIGQSLMLSFAGPEATPALLAALADIRPCGIILFADNIRTPAELYTLISTLQAHAATLGLPPLLIGIDQEGGTVSRLPAPFVTVPSQMAQTATGDPAVAYRCASITGQQLRAFGINTVFAPVLDINCNPANPVIGTRAWGQDTATVTTFGLEALRGYRDTGVIATAKHFPGHGDTAIDSHLGLPTVRHGRSRLEAMELAPFVAAIKAGVPALMTAHIIFEALDTLPATLSHTILNELLRAELGYDGVIFTDALDMQAISGTYGPIEAALRSKAAGADVLMPLGTLAAQQRIAQALRAAVTDGRLPRAAFEDTARRLDALRSAYTLTHELPRFAEPEPTLAQAALDIARRGITLVRGGAELPLPHTTRLALIDCIQPRFSLVETELERAEMFSTLVQAAFPHTTPLTLGPEPTDADLLAARALAQDCDMTLLITRNAALIEPQARLAQALTARGRVIHAAVRSPYDADVVPDATTTLLAYGDPAVSLHALVDVLAGRVPATGILPVTLGSVIQTREA
jgi:beta-N-acetylhexosaminidase